MNCENENAAIHACMNRGVDDSKRLRLSLESEPHPELRLTRLTAAGQLRHQQEVG